MPVQSTAPRSSRSHPQRKSQTTKGERRCLSTTTTTRPAAPVRGLVALAGRSSSWPVRRRPRRGHPSRAQRPDRLLSGGRERVRQVWTANPDLTAEHQLTHGDANSGWPVWAPDASRIAFDSDRSDPDPTDEEFVNDVFTMRPDGTDVRKLTDSVGFSGDPAYSPDGSLVAFDANRGTSAASRMARPPPDLNIFVIGSDGTGMRRVTTPPRAAPTPSLASHPTAKGRVHPLHDGSLFKSGRVVATPPPCSRSTWTAPDPADHRLGRSRPGGLVSRRQADRVRDRLLPLGAGASTP